LFHINSPPPLDLSHHSRTVLDHSQYFFVGSHIEFATKYPNNSQTMIRYKDFYPSLLVFVVVLKTLLSPPIPDVAAASVSYLRKSSSQSENFDSFQQKLLGLEKRQWLSQKAAVVDRPKRRFYARYGGEDGRRLVQQLCGSNKIVEDLDSSDYSLFEDLYGGDDVDDSVQENSCWKKLQQRSEIALVEEDHPVQAFSIDGTDNNEATESNDVVISWGIAAIQADQLEMGPNNVTVCIVDTGIASQHPDFDYDRISGVDRMDRPTVWYWNHDRAGHGTHVSGIVAASSNNGYGVKGLGDFSLLIVRALGDDGNGFESDIWKAVENCIEHGANIINMYAKIDSHFCNFVISLILTSLVLTQQVLGKSSNVQGCRRNLHQGS
jgi:hypothetical protein